MLKHIALVCCVFEIYTSMAAAARLDPASVDRDLNVIAFRGSVSTPDGTYLMVNNERYRLSSDGDENSQAYSDTIRNRDAVASWVKAGNPVVLPEPITSQILSNAARVARQGMVNQPQAQALMIATLEQRLFQAQDRMRSCAAARARLETPTGSRQAPSGATRN